MAINWKKKVGWAAAVAKVKVYYAGRPDLKYGPGKQDKADAVIDDLCSGGTVARSDLMTAHALSEDAILTILSNVTMALQQANVVAPPEQGGWYVSLSDPRRYIVSPGFAAAWLGLQ